MGDPCTTASLDVPLNTPQSYDGLSYLGVSSLSLTLLLPLPRVHLVPSHAPVSSPCTAHDGGCSGRHGGAHSHVPRGHH